MNKDQEIYIKYLEGSFARSSKKRADFLFFLLLKSNYSSGYIQDSFSEIGYKLGKTKHTSFNRLQSLIKRGWVIRYTKGKTPAYRLISYKNLYVSLGYELKVKEKGFKGCYQFYKIPLKLVSKNEKELKNLINGFDCQRRIQRMQIENFSSTSMKGEMTRDRLNSVTLPLSAAGFARIAGYKASKKGWEISKLLEQRNLIKIERGFTSKGKFHSFHYKQLRENTNDFKDSAFFKQTSGNMGEVFERCCNKVKLASIVLTSSY